MVCCSVTSLIDLLTCEAPMLVSLRGSMMSGKECGNEELYSHIRHCGYLNDLEKN